MSDAANLESLSPTDSAFLRDDVAVRVALSLLHRNVRVVNRSVVNGASDRVAAVSSHPHPAQSQSLRPLHAGPETEAPLLEPRSAL